MDELELLKKDWNKEDHKYPKLTYNEIYKMILKRSSSIVKWIFIISLLEFIFWTFISLLLKDNENIKRFDQFNNDAAFITLMVVGYIILAYFFYCFFKNYKTISATDNAKVLMENILKTRKTVKQYVAFNLIYLVISTIIILIFEFKKDPIFIEQVNQATANGQALKFYVLFIVIVLIFLIVVIGILLLFYWAAYGLLLKRLNRNYKELQKLEI